MKYYLAYKCRLCGEVELVQASWNVVDSDMFFATCHAAGLPMPHNVKQAILDAKPAALVIFHDCPNGVNGLADFVGGMRKVKEDTQEV